MKKMITTLCLPVMMLSAQPLQAQTYQSSENRVHLLELYTSEGCNSCPPAEHWVNQLYQKGIDEVDLIPLVFHVTYWNYLGWQDRFSQREFDNRQRKMVQNEGGRTVYTPQFFLNKKTYRSIRNLPMYVKRNHLKAGITLKADLKDQGGMLSLKVNLEKNTNTVEPTRIYAALVESHILSSIESGENSGRNATHNYLVRQLQSSAYSNQQVEFRFSHNKEWKRDNQHLVLFAEGKEGILQSMKISLE